MAVQLVFHIIQYKRSKQTIYTMMKFPKLIAFAVLLFPLVVRAWVQPHYHPNGVPRTSGSPYGGSGGPLFLSDSPDAADQIKKGNVKWFDTTKGFGFITPDDGTDDVFVHQTAIRAEGFRSLADGEAVEFVVETDNSGKLKAAKVTGPDGSDVQGATMPNWKRSSNE